MRKIFPFLTIIFCTVLFGCSGTDLQANVDLQTNVSTAGAEKIVSVAGPETQGVVFFMNKQQDFSDFFTKPALADDYDTIIFLDTGADLMHTMPVILTGGSPLTQQIQAQGPGFIRLQNIQPGTNIAALMPLVKKYFSETEIVTMKIQYSLSEKQLEELASLLNRFASPRTLIVLPLRLPLSSDASAASFQQQYFADMVAHFDNKRLNSAELWQEKTLKLFHDFMHLRGVEQAEINNAGAFVTFHKGKDLNSGRVFLVSFGDIMLGRAVRSRMNKNGLDYPFRNIDAKYLQYNDLLLANLEGPIAKNAVKTSKTIAFRFLPDVAPLLKQFHFDVLSLANNHALDMGQQGYQDTFDLLRETGLTPFGNPKEITEESIAKMKIGDQNIAFLGLEEVVFDIDDAKAVETVKQLTNEGYKVIPVIHWGVEYVHKPNTRQKELAHKLIDAGAFAVIAHHPHVVQAYETYHGHPIFYSLGNAVFDQEFSAATQEGLSIALAFNDESMEILFMPIKIDRSQMRLMNEDERKKFLERMVTFAEYSAEEKAALLEGKLVLQF